MCRCLWSNSLLGISPRVVLLDQMVDRCPVCEQLKRKRRKFLWMFYVVMIVKNSLPNKMPMVLEGKKKENYLRIFFG
jgi:hypothetical protein